MWHKMMNPDSRTLESMMRYFGVAMILCHIILYPSALSAAEPIKHQITGLFSPERVEDLERVFKELPEFKLLGVDFKTAEVSLEYDSATVFPNATPEQIVERFDSKLRNASRHTFGIKPLCPDRKKLELVEIPVAGLDCTACCLAAYEAIYRLDGVEQATASFKVGLVTAWIDPAKTDRAMLEEALRKKEVELQTVAP